MSPNGKRIRDGKNADLKFYERTDDVEKWECLTIDWRAKKLDAARHISHYRLNEEQKNQMRLGIFGGQEIKNSKLIQCINIRFGPYIYSLSH